MEVNGQQGDERKRNWAIVLQLIAIVILFPFLWIGVAVNFLGIAERLSFLPGVSRDGGFISSGAVLIMTVLVLVVIASLVITATGGSLPMIGGGADDPMDHATPTPTPSPTPTQFPVTTETPTPTTEHMTDLERFEKDFRSRINITMTTDSFTGVPILATEYHRTERGLTELWIVYWECDRLDSVKEQRVAIGNLYVNATGNFAESQPDRLRVYGVTNLEQYNDSITHIPTSEAEATWLREMSPANYTENWNNRLRYPNSAETEIAYQMVVNESGQELAKEAFDQHHREIGDCPGGAQDPTPPSQSNTNSIVSVSGVPPEAEPIIG